MQIGDGTNDWGLRVFGSTSGPGAPRCDCSCSTVYVNLAMHVEAIEENEDIDVTPCTDANGIWAPRSRVQCPADRSDDWNGHLPNLHRAADERRSARVARR